jgi:hypothetical protein
MTAFLPAYLPVRRITTFPGCMYKHTCQTVPRLDKPPGLTQNDGAAQRTFRNFTIVLSAAAPLEAAELEKAESRPLCCFLPVCPVGFRFQRREGVRQVLGIIRLSLLRLARIHNQGFHTSSVFTVCVLQ